MLIENLGMKLVAAKCVPYLLTEEQKQTTFKSVKNFLTVQTMMKNV
jgi:hypothetical protein